MLDDIKKAIFAKYTKTDNKWLFLSTFDQNWLPKTSNWVINSDKELNELIETLYHWIIENQKDINNITIDIVTETQEIKDVKEIKNIPLQEYGILISSENKSWVLLPNTQWVTNIQDALKLIKEKNSLWGNIKIFKFKTDRFST